MQGLIACGCLVCSESVRVCELYILADRVVGYAHESLRLRPMLRLLVLNDLQVVRLVRDDVYLEFPEQVSVQNALRVAGRHMVLAEEDEGNAMRVFRDRASREVQAQEERTRSRHPVIACVHGNILEDGCDRLRAAKNVGVQP